MVQIKIFASRATEVSIEERLEIDKYLRDNYRIELDLLFIQQENYCRPEMSRNKEVI
jgi:hypothetical protein